MIYKYLQYIATSPDKSKAYEILSKIRNAGLFDPAKAKRGVGGKSREKVVLMPADHFLDLALPGTNQDSVERVAAMIRNGVKFEEPYLNFINLGDGRAKIVGHEGRHRTRASKYLGFPAVPVRLRSLENGYGPAIRWESDHANPKSFDYVEKFPKVFLSEADDKIIRPFPVIRDREGDLDLRPLHKIVGGPLRDAYKRELLTAARRSLRAGPKDSLLFEHTTDKVFNRPIHDPPKAGDTVFFRVPNEDLRDAQESFQRGSGRINWHPSVPYDNLSRFFNKALRYHRFRTRLEKKRKGLFLV